MKLDLYNKKRDFKKTPEPKGKISNRYKNLFIIQKHAASHLHYDFRLELNGVLLSWAIPKGPCLDPTVKRLAMHVEDHPVEYGHFEGIIPKGEYGGGTVMLWDEGIWLPEDENPTKAYHAGHLRFTLEAKKLKGRFNLFRFKKDDPKAWFLVKAKDKYAKPLSEYDITLKKPKSVLSKLSLDEITKQYENIWSEGKLKKKAQKKLTLDLPKASFPKNISPELATLVNHPPEGDAWLHEIKLDGYRILAYKQGKQVKLKSRNNKEWTAYFMNVVKAISKLPIENLLLDGEIVLLDEAQHSNFQLLQNAINAKIAQPFIYYAFDLLYYDHYQLMSLPLIERKEILQKLITDNSILRYSDHIIGKGEQVFKNACKLKLEGIVAKAIHSPYQEKRTKDWLKIKCSERQEFVIGGYTNPQGAREYFGSLFLGIYNKKGELEYCGNVGTGFNQQSLKTIYQLLLKYKSTQNPFNSRPPGVTSANWVKPQLVAEIEFSEWTEDNILRHPSFKGLREDKPAKAITKEVKSEISERVMQKKLPPPFKLTHPNKILFSEDKITKLDLANYYTEIQDWILPYLVNRPLTLVRCPENYKTCFYQKHLNKSHPKNVYSIPIQTNTALEEYIYIKDFAGLIALVQMGTLEFHPWGSKIEKLDYPDMITIDLDPAPEIVWKKVVATAKLIKKQLDVLKLKSFVKTTGGKGLHVVIPLQPKHDWETVKDFTHAFVKSLVAKYPSDYIGEMSKIKRRGKIFIDYLRNQRGATAISAYSTRARKGAPVSVPLAWRELTDDFSDTFYTIKTLPARLKKLRKDPWEDFFKVKQSLTKLLK